MAACMHAQVPAQRSCGRENRCCERSSTTTRMDTVGCAALTSRSGPTSSSWGSVVANAHPWMMPHCARREAPRAGPPGRAEAAAPAPSSESACALLRRSAFGTPHDRKLSAGHRGWLLPRACPPLLIQSMLPAPRHTARRHAPAWPRRSPPCSWPRFVDACTAHARRRTPDGPCTSRRLRNEDDPIAQVRPLAFLFNAHDEVNQGLNSQIRQLVQRPWWYRIVPPVTARKETSTLRIASVDGW